MTKEEIAEAQARCDVSGEDDCWCYVLTRALASASALLALRDRIAEAASSYDHKAFLHRSTLREFGTTKAEIWEGFSAELRALLTTETTDA